MTATDTARLQRLELDLLEAQATIRQLEDELIVLRSTTTKEK